MALFGKNPNEVAYTGGKKHWADVIKNTVRQKALYAVPRTGVFFVPW